MANKNNKANNVAVETATVEKENVLETKRIELAALQAEIIKERERQRVENLTKVNALPAQFGLETMDQFLEMVANVTGRKNTKRARISKETKDQITAALKVGNKSAKELAAQFGVSAPSINVLKKAAGLTKSRG